MKQSGLFLILSNKMWCNTRDGICLQAKIAMKATVLPQSIKGKVQSKASGLSIAKIKRTIRQDLLKCKFTLCFSMLYQYL